MSRDLGLHCDHTYVSVGVPARKYANCDRPISITEWFKDDQKQTPWYNIKKPLEASLQPAVTKYTGKN